MESFTFTSQERAMLKAANIGALVLFGSQAQGTAGPLSDFDFGVVIPGSARVGFSEHRKDIYDTLYDLLSAKIKRLVDIDIVFLHEAPMDLQAHVMKYGQALYEVRPDVFAEFREDVIERYADFAPLRAVFHEAILERIR